MRPIKMPDPNLTAALKLSLAAVNDGPSREPPDFATDSPLREVLPTSLAELTDRVNQKLVAGLPEEITDELLDRYVDLWRAEALRWRQEEEIKAAKTPRKRQKGFDADTGPGEVLDIL